MSDSHNTELDNFIPYAKSVILQLIRDNNHDGLQMFVDDLSKTADDIYDLIDNVPKAWQQHKQIVDELENRQRVIKEQQDRVSQLNQQLEQAFGVSQSITDSSNDEALSSLLTDDSDSSDEDDDKGFFSFDDDEQYAPDNEQSLPPDNDEQGDSDDDDDDYFAAFDNGYDDNGPADSWGSPYEAARPGENSGDADDIGSDSYDMSPEQPQSSDMPDDGDIDINIDDKDIANQLAQQAQPQYGNMSSQSISQSQPQQPSANAQSDSDTDSFDGDGDILLSDDFLAGLT